MVFVNAVIRKSYEAVDFLLEKGANPDAPSLPYQPICQSAGDGEIKMIEKLLSAGASANCSSGRILLPLFAALSSPTNGAAIVRLLLQHGADHKSIISGSSLLHHWANVSGNEDVFDLLSSPVEGRDAYGYTPLLCAAIVSKNAFSTEVLLRRGAKVDAVDRNEQTALCRALRAQHKDCMFEKCRTLIAYGADYNRRFPTREAPNQSALSIVLEVGEPSIVALLLSKGAKLQEPRSLFEAWRDTRPDQWHKASDVSLLRTLLDYGANPNQHDSNGKTPLIIACGFPSRSDQHLVIKELVEYGADVSKASMLGQSPLRLILDHDIMRVEDKLEVLQCFSGRASTGAIRSTVDRMTVQLRKRL